MQPQLITPTIIATALILGYSQAAISESSKQQLQEIRRNISVLQQDLGSNRKQQSQLRNKLSKLEKNIAQLSRDLRSIKSKLKRQRHAQTTLLQETHELGKKLSLHRNNLGQQIRAGYSAGQQQALKMLLNQANPAEAGRIMTYYGYFTDAQLKAVKETQRNIQQLNSAEKKLQKNSAKLESLQIEKQKRQQALNKKKDKRKTILASLNSDINNQEQKLKRLKEDEQALAKVLRNLPTEQGLTTQNFSELSQLKGKLRWPVKGHLKHKYGESRNQGRTQWQGVIINGDEGQDIRAIAAGRVVFSDWIRGYGLMLIIDHGNGYMSLYGHNQSLYKDTGEQIKPNEVIAALGSSGGNNEHGLYFELRHKGKPLNPAKWCR